MGDFGVKITFGQKYLKGYGICVNCVLWEPSERVRLNCPRQLICTCPEKIKRREQQNGKREAEKANNLSARARKMSKMTGESSGTATVPMSDR